MRTILIVAAGLGLFAWPALAQTTEDILARYVKTSGGPERIAAVQTLRRTGRLIREGGFELGIVQENKRPNLVREDVIRQGMVGIHAYDGAMGWKISPWQGKKDPEALSEEEMKSILEDADFDGPLIGAGRKGIHIEYLGTGDVEGTNVYRLKVTDPKGPTYVYSMDQETCIPLKIETRRMVRGAPREYETLLGNYKQVAGVMMPFLLVTNVKGSSDLRRTVYDTIEANVDIADGRFHRPAAPAAPRP